MDAIARRPRPGRGMSDLVLDACAGRVIALHDVGVAVGGLFVEAAKQLPGDGAESPDAVVGLAAVTERWLRGDVDLTFDAEGLSNACGRSPAPSRRTSSRRSSTGPGRRPGVPDCGRR